jgi:ribosomal protein S27E
MTPICCPNPACNRSIDLDPTRPRNPNTCPYCGEPLPKPKAEGKRLSLRDLVERRDLTTKAFAPATLAFECSHPDCKASIRASKDSVGKHVVCPKCGRVVVVTDGRESDADAEPVRIECPVCRNPILAWPRQAGRIARCPLCARRIAIPADLGSSSPSKQKSDEEPAGTPLPMPLFEVDGKPDPTEMSPVGPPETLSILDEDFTFDHDFGFGLDDGRPARAAEKEEEKTDDRSDRIDLDFLKLD